MAQQPPAIDKTEPAAVRPQATVVVLRSSLTPEPGHRAQQGQRGGWPSPPPPAPPKPGGRVHQGRVLPKCLKQCSAWSQGSVNICEMNECGDGQETLGREPPTLTRRDVAGSPSLHGRPSVSLPRNILWAPTMCLGPGAPDVAPRGPWPGRRTDGGSQPVWGSKRGG